MLVGNMLETVVIVKAIVIVLLLVILINLGSALVFLVKDKGQTHRTLTALKWRIGLSISLFILLMIGFATGLIQPHGIV